jgi:endonuclease/exonuclease/phosphatase family metal-dependent hydrolase
MDLGKTINRLAFTINILVAAALLFSYFTGYVSPETTVFFAFFGLAYPVLLIANLLFILYWGIKRNKRVVLSIVVLVIGFSQFTQFFQFPFSLEEKLEGHTIRVMSYNVRLFDLYDWTKKENVKDKILELVNEQSPDVICFQEYYLKGGTSELKKALNMRYLHEHFSKTSIKQRKKAGVGTAIYSKYKIINKGKVLFENEIANHCVFVDILKNNDTIRVYNAHLGSIRFDYDDYTFIAGKKIKGDEDEKDMLPIFKVIKRLKIGFKKRVGQINKLLTHIQNSPYPTIVGADMNDTPVSYSYKQFSVSLKDSFKEKGKWVGSTYIGAIPLLRIDYLWHNTKLENKSFSTIDKEYSDHRPIVGEYVMIK